MSKTQQFTIDLQQLEESNSELWVKQLTNHYESNPSSDINQRKNICDLFNQVFNIEKTSLTFIKSFDNTNKEIIINFHQQTFKELVMPDLNNILIKFTQCGITTLDYRQTECLSIDNVQILSGNEVSTLFLCKQIINIDFQPQKNKLPNKLTRIIFCSYEFLESLIILETSIKTISCDICDDTINLSKFPNLKIVKIGNLLNDILLPESLEELELVQYQDKEFTILNTDIIFVRNSIVIKNFNLAKLIFQKYRSITLIGCSIDELVVDQLLMQYREEIDNLQLLQINIPIVFEDCQFNYLDFSESRVKNLNDDLVKSNNKIKVLVLPNLIENFCLAGEYDNLSQNNQYSTINEIHFSEMNNIREIQILESHPKLVFNSNQNIINLSAYTNLQNLTLGEIQNDIILPQQPLQVFQLSQNKQFQYKIQNKTINSKFIKIQNFDLTKADLIGFDDIWLNKCKISDFKITNLQTFKKQIVDNEISQLLMELELPEQQCLLLQNKIKILILKDFECVDLRIDSLQHITVVDSLQQDSQYIKVIQQNDRNQQQNKKIIIKNDHKLDLQLFTKLINLELFNISNQILLQPNLSSIKIENSNSNPNEIDLSQLFLLQTVKIKNCRIKNIALPYPQNQQDKLLFKFNSNIGNSFSMESFTQIANKKNSTKINILNNIKALIIKGLQNMTLHSQEQEIQKDTINLQMFKNIRSIELYDIQTKLTQNSFPLKLINLKLDNELFYEKPTQPIHSFDLFEHNKLKFINFKHSIIEKLITNFCPVIEKCNVQILKTQSLIQTTHSFISKYQPTGEQNCVRLLKPLQFKNSSIRVLDLGYISDPLQDIDQFCNTYKEHCKYALHYDYEIKQRVLQDANDKNIKFVFPRQIVLEHKIDHINGLINENLND